MCGIIGGNLFKDKEDLVSSLKTISHRGRDFTDVKIFPSKMNLGHNRLSIQDLSPKSNQPFQSSCGRFHLVFNGELWKSTFDEWNDKLRKKYQPNTQPRNNDENTWDFSHHIKEIRR